MREHVQEQENTEGTITAKGVKEETVELTVDGNKRSEGVISCITTTWR
jgi:hypothetical protein